MHDRNLLFGIYEDVGKKTCAGYPGSESHYETDAQTFADWNCDYLKFDGCHYPPENGHIGYPAMRKSLNATGKAIMYSCEWPFYQEEEASLVNYTDVSENCNLWRNFNDVFDSWVSILSIIEFYHKHQDLFAQFHGPGQWNDPDMVTTRKIKNRINFRLLLAIQELLSTRRKYNSLFGEYNSPEEKNFPV